MGKYVWPPLPATWHLVRFGDFAKVAYGKALKAEHRQAEGSFKVYGSGGIVGTHNEFLHEGPSIIIGRKGTVGAVYYADEPFWCIDTAYYLGELDGYIDIEYLVYLLRYINLARLTIVVGVPGLNRQDLESVEIPLPPLAEQQRIVEILKQAEIFYGEWGGILEQAKRLPSELFLKMFGDPRDYPKRWGTQEFGHFITHSKYGPRFLNREYSEVGARILRTTDMEGNGSLRWWESPVMAVTEEELEQHTLQPGTLLVSRSGTIGPVALFSGADESCIAGAYLIEFGLSNEINHRFIIDFFLSEYGQAVLTGGSQSMTQANLNAPTIKKIAIPTPPRELQDKYEEMSDGIRDFISSEEEEIKKFEVVTSSLIASGFTGELTQSWREEHHEELETWLQEHTGNLPKKPMRVSAQEATLPERSTPKRSTRSWVIGQLSNTQNQVYAALAERQGVFIPSEELDRFLGEWLVEPLEDVYVEDTHDHVLRALDQLAGLGLIARVSIPNQTGEYVTGYRILREEELTKTSDLDRLKALS